MKKIALYIAALASVSACIYPYSPDISSEVNHTLVVEGEILVGGTSTIKLSYLEPLGGSSNMTPAGRAWIEDENGKTYQSANPSLMTNVISVPTDDAVTGIKYRSVIEVDGQQYSSDWVEPLTPPVIENVHFSADEKDVYVLADINAGNSGSGYVGFTYEEDWEFHADFIPEAEIDPKTWEYNYMIAVFPPYWCYKHANAEGAVLVNYSTTDGTVIKDCVVKTFPRTNSRNHKKYYILVKAYNMSEEAFRYDNYIEELSSVGGNLFSPEPGQMEGNLHCDTDAKQKVLGMVRAAQMSSKRASIRTEFLIEPEPNYRGLVIPRPDEYEHLYYVSNYRPAVTVTVGDEEGLGWGPERCIDCTKDGGTLEKPSFWE